MCPVCLHHVTDILIDKVQFSDKNLNQWSSFFVNPTGDVSIGRRHGDRQGQRERRWREEEKRIG